MLTKLWLTGLIGRRSGRMLGAMAGVGLTVAVLVSVAAFIASSATSMTRRAIESVPVDWQILLAPGTDVGTVTAALSETTAYAALETVGYAEAAGFEAMGMGSNATGQGAPPGDQSVQTTGPGKVLGIAPSYRGHFPAEVRLLLGSVDGVLVAQQTAANLHVGVGDSITVMRPGLPPAAVKVDGIVDLPNADSLFQAVGVPPGTAPQAPPDNVLLLPAALWHTLFDPQAGVRPDSVRTQLHVRLAAGLPADPAAAYTRVQGLARHLEARIAGSGAVGDNLGARLDGARSDALYARVLFLFLGLPGVLLAVLLTLSITASGAGRRTREQALLRARGASTAQILRLACAEALLVGGGGAVLGMAVAVVATNALAALNTVGAMSNGTAGLTPGGASPVPPLSPATWLSSGLEVLMAPTTRGWTLGAVLFGLVVALVAMLYPAWAQARRSTVVAARASLGRGRQPLWQRAYVDVVLLAISLLMFWRTAATGYQVVLAPEGVPQASVAYESFLGPLCLWLGGALLAVRGWAWLLDRGRPLLAAAIRPVAAGLSNIVAASLGRQQARVMGGLVLVTLAFSFAISTAVFNTTFNAQARVDAELTNGADVVVTGQASSPPGGQLAALAALPGVVGASAMQHRFAYVGNDLQDLYGIDPATIAQATHLANAFFANGNAARTLATLASQPDGVLVAAETVSDFQLVPGDLVNLRLQNARTHGYEVVPFHLVGIVREFPTAPKDSFLVANAAYIAEKTGSSAAEVVLLRANGAPAGLAARVRPLVRMLPGARVTDLGQARQSVGSSLTAVDLGGLTRLELGFAVLLLAAATGLVMALGLADRRRTFAILTSLGARPRQLGAFLWAEGLLVLVGGGLAGTALGFGVAAMLVKVLTGVFDPPPEALAIPWPYLALLAAAATLSTASAVLGAQVASGRSATAAMRGD